ncbi:MAG: hypothetical protein EHM41_26800 [Chloroflexi bacterium]|nr:MAG: hypothetical protein EHM41_26800 [Chloroflexota bacterium]
MKIEDYQGATGKILSAQELLKNRRKSGINLLDRLFRSGTLPDASLSGGLAGKMIDIHISPLLTQIVQFIYRTWKPWQGKVFYPNRSLGYNLIPHNSLILYRMPFPLYREYRVSGQKTVQAFPFQISIGPGIKDPDVQVMKLDYNLSGNPRLTFRRLMDELVYVGEGVYLGKAHFQWYWGRWQTVGYFSLSTKR